VPMDRVAKRLAEYSWPYASQDPVAFDAIARRVAAAGARRELLTYSEVVSGIDFHLPSVHGGEAVRLGVPEWTDLHRAIVGDFLGRLCLDTYVAGHFMGSALVVASETGQPSEGYRGLMRDLGLLHGRSDDEFLSHWVAEVQKAYAWYAEHP
jgi:hypothetical protein